MSRQGSLGLKLYYNLSNLEGEPTTPARSIRKQVQKGTHKVTNRGTPQYSSWRIVGLTKTQERQTWTSAETRTRTDEKLQPVREGIIRREIVWDDFEGLGAAK